MPYSYQKHITSNPKILFGKPVIRGTRIPVALVLEKLAHGAAVEELIAAYPRITKEDVSACLAYAQHCN